MRPKKVILYINANEQETSVMKFMLETNCYRVLTANLKTEAAQLFGGLEIDLVLSDWLAVDSSGAATIAALKAIKPHIPMILLGEPEVMAGQIHQADALLRKSMLTSVELLERIRIMAARKRGPRKGTARAILEKIEAEEALA